MTSPSEFIKQQLDKPADDSKKWNMAMYGLKGIMFFFVSGGLIFLFKADLADKMVTLVNIAITAWGGVVAVFLGAQGTVEYKATSALQTLNAPVDAAAPPKDCKPKVDNPDA